MKLNRPTIFLFAGLISLLALAKHGVNGAYMLMGADNIEEVLKSMHEMGDLDSKQFEKVIDFVGANKDLGAEDTMSRAIGEGLADPALLAYLRTQTLTGRMSSETADYLTSVLNLQKAGPIRRATPNNYDNTISNGIIEPLGRWTAEGETVPSSGVLYNGIWGYATADKEYALQCTYNGVHIVDITDPTQPDAIQFIAMPGGRIWRDAVTHTDAQTGKTYAYVGGQGGNANTWVLDLSFLDTEGTIPESGYHVLDDTTDLGHTINAGGGFLFVNSAERSEGILIFDLQADPWNPPLVARWRLGDGHDSFFRANVSVFGRGERDVLFSADGFRQKHTFLDLTDVRRDYASTGQPAELNEDYELGSTRRFPGTYAHSNAFTEDGEFMFVFDEINRIDMAVYSIGNLGRPFLRRIFQWSGESNEDSIVHNGHVRGNYLYVAYYEAGLRVFDISNPVRPIEVGHLDTWRDPENDGVFQNSISGSFNGAWNTYVYLPSGNILVSDTSNGLFIVGVNSQV